MTPDNPDAPAGRRRVPGRALAAGVLWVAYGVLQIGLVVLWAVLAARAGDQPVSPAAGLGLLFGIAFGYIGYRTATGAAGDTIGNGVGSLLFGLYNAAVAGVILFAVSAGQLVAPSRAAVLVGAWMAVLFAAMLLSAGVLALAGRSEYRAWRAENRRAG